MDVQYKGQSAVCKAVSLVVCVCVCVCVCLFVCVCYVLCIVYSVLLVLFPVFLNTGLQC